MAVDNRRWGTKRIRGELLKLGMQVNRETIRRYIWQARRGLPPHDDGQTWATFLANHASEIWACDFVQTYDLFFRTVFVYFIAPALIVFVFARGINARFCMDGMTWRDC